MTRDERVLSVMPMAHAIVREVTSKQLPASSPDYEDLLAAGLAKLASGMGTFNPRLSSWSTFAWILIRRGVLNERRKQLSVEARTEAWSEIVEDEVHAPQHADYESLASLPRIYRRVMAAGSPKQVMASMGLPRSSAKELFSCTPTYIRKRLGLL